MNRLTVLILIFSVNLLAACTPAVSQDSAEPQNLPLLDIWSGDYPVTALGQLPAGQQESSIGYIGDAATFAGIWKSYIPADPLPEIDFAKNLVIFSRNVHFYNRTNILKVVLDADGVIEVLAMQTLSARPIEDKVAMAMVVIPRDGVIRLKTGENTSVPVE